MSNTANVEEELGRDPKKDHPPYKFTVDGNEFESEQRVLTGAQIKARAKVDPSFGLFLERHGHIPDEPIADDQRVDLREPGKEHFYTAPPANFGCCQ